MASFILMIESNCSDPAKEDEFNEWYTKVHVQDVLKTGIVKKATRYEATAPPAEGRGKFVAIYEIESDDIAATMDEYKSKMKVIAEGRFSTLMRPACGGTFKILASFEKK